MGNPPETKAKSGKLGPIIVHTDRNQTAFLLQRDAMLARYMPWPRVCLSVTSRCYIKMAQRTNTGHFGDILLSQFLGSVGLRTNALTVLHNSPRL